MGLLGRIFAPKVSKLENRGDVDGIIDLLNSEAPPETRVSAVEALARSDDGRRIQILVDTMADPTPEVAAAAGQAVRELGSKAGDALVQTLATSTGDDALELVLGFGDDAVDLLHTAYKTLSAEGRRRALAGLIRRDEEPDGVAHHEIVFSTLLAAIGDRSPQIRILAAGHLKRLGDARAGRALAAQLKDGDETVRAACRQALGTLGDDVVPNLLGALEDRNTNSRRIAAELLGEICSGDSSPETRIQALSALALRMRDSDAEIASAVKNAITTIAREDVVQSQMELFADPDRYDREDIREFLERMLAHGCLPGSLSSRVEHTLANSPVDS